jgi:hypothetical protein
MIRLDTLPPGARFRVLGHVGTVLRVNACRVYVDWGRETVAIGETEFTRPVRDNIAPATEVEVVW